MPRHRMARPFTPRNPRLVACPEMWHHYVFDRAINTTGLSPAGSQNCRLLHLGGTLRGYPGMGGVVAASPCRVRHCVPANRPRASSRKSIPPQELTAELTGFPDRLAPWESFPPLLPHGAEGPGGVRSEERRVGKEGGD